MPRSIADQCLKMLDDDVLTMHELTRAIALFRERKPPLGSRIYDAVGDALVLSRSIAKRYAGQSRIPRMENEAWRLAMLRIQNTPEP